MQFYQIIYTLMICLIQYKAKSKTLRQHDNTQFATHICGYKIIIWKLKVKIVNIIIQNTQVIATLIPIIERLNPRMKKIA